MEAGYATENRAVNPKVSALFELDEEINALSQTVQDLEGRLSPILEDKNVREAPAKDFGGISGIRERASRIRNIHSEILEIISRIDL